MSFKENRPDSALLRLHAIIFECRKESDECLKKLKAIESDPNWHGHQNESRNSSGYSKHDCIRLEMDTASQVADRIATVIIETPVDTVVDIVVKLAVASEIWHEELERLPDLIRPDLERLVARTKGQ